MKQLITLILLSFLTLYTNAQIGLPIQQAVLPKNSLVVNYDFSKSSSFTRGSGTVTNIAGTASGNATIVNSPIFMNSLGFVSFNGVNQYVISPNLRPYFKAINTTVQKSFTMSLWFYPTGLNGVIVSEHESQTLNSGFFTSNIELVNGFIKYKVWDATPITSALITLNKWYHVSMVYDGTTLKGYLNGVSQGSQTYDRVIPPAGQFYGIGSTSSTAMGTGAYGNFNLAQYKIHNLPFTDKEILQEYESRKDEFDYTIHSPSTNSNPTYWGISSAWAGETIFNLDHYTPWLNNTRLGWAAAANDVNQWITLNYDDPAFIKGVVIQPRANSGNQFVTKVNVQTSLTGAAPWTSVMSNVSLGTNITDDALVLFPSNVYAKSVRILPVEWTNHITLRLGMLVKPNNYVTNGLVLNLDPANIKSYQGSGSTLSDLSTSSNHATLIGSPTHNASNGLTFNGTSQYGRIPSVNGVSNFTNTQQYSVEIWFNPSNGQPNAGEAELLEKWDLNNEPRYPYVFRYNENLSRMFVACYDGSNFPSLSVSGIPVNTWKQIVGVFDFVTKTLTVYKDGVSAGSISLNGVGQVSNSSPTAIGTRLNSSSGYLSGIMFKGTVGIIRMYNKALSSTEILQNFNANKTRYGL